jgi:hypothetical protein
VIANTAVAEVCLMSLPNKRILEILKNYVKDEKNSQAIMLNSKWGIGIKDAVDKYIKYRTLGTNALSTLSQKPLWTLEYEALKHNMATLKVINSNGKRSF